MHWGFSCRRFLILLAGHTESFVRNSQHVTEILDKFKVQRTDISVSFNLVSLYTNVPVNETLQIILNKFSLDDTLPNRPSLQTEDIMELLEVCIRNTYFHVEDRFY
jgi:hypothetical protein